MWNFNDNFTLNFVANIMMILLLFEIIVDCSQQKEWNKRPAAGKFVLWLAVLMLFLAMDNAVAVLLETGVNQNQEVIISVVWFTLGGCVHIPPLLWELALAREHTKVSNTVSVILVSLIVAAIVISDFIITNDEGFDGGMGWYLTVLKAGVLLCLAVLISHIAAMLTYRRIIQKRRVIWMLVYTVGPIICIILPWWKRIPGNLMLVSVTFLIYMNMWKEQKEELVATRLDMMRSQIQPHFIYNSLSAIASLCDIDPAQAKQTTLDFSEYLETNLSSVNEKGTIPFLKELRHVDAYLRIEKTRFGDFIKVEYRLRATDFELPPLTIQPLVENAVKHGLCPSENGGTVIIETMEYPDGWKVCVHDDGVGFDNTPDMKKGIGIENVRQRIAMQCKGTLTIESEKDVGTIAIMFLPKGGIK